MFEEPNISVCCWLDYASWEVRDFCNFDCSHPISYNLCVHTLCRNIAKLYSWTLELTTGGEIVLGLESSSFCKQWRFVAISVLYIWPRTCQSWSVFCLFVSLFKLSTSEPDAHATLDKMFDEMAFKQNDSKLVFSHLLCCLTKRLVDRWECAV